MKKSVILLLILFSSIRCLAQHPAKVAPVYKTWPHYNVDGLLQSFHKNKLLDSLLNDGSKFYDDIHLDEKSISREAFLIGYLGKRLDQMNKIRINQSRQVRWPLNTLLMVVDFTKTADEKRMVIVDVAARKLLFNTYVGHGKGKYFEDPFNVTPRFFTNTIGANLSSLGFMVTGGPKMPPGNPCHFCRLNIDGPKHNEQLYVYGFEKNFNDKAFDRKILVHTTGSKDLSDPAIEKRLPIDNKNYRINEKKGLCYFGKTDSSTVYASKVYIDSTGYIGRSDGCFVVPEEEHKAIVETIRRGTMIYSYSNVIVRVYDYNYFKGSPVIKAIMNLTNYSTGVIMLSQ